MIDGEKFGMMTQRSLVWVTEYVTLFSIIRSKKKNPVSTKDEFVKSQFEFSAVYFLCGRLSCRYKFGGQKIY